MVRDELDAVLKEGESVTVEFKRCGDRPHPDVFETVCSFANRLGGSIYLGVNDDGAVEGIDPKRAVEVERNIANVISNRNLFSPAPNVETERIDCDGRVVIRILVMSGSSVIRFKGVVYDRLADTDVRVDGDIQISQMYIRKQNYYSERRIFRYVTPFDLRSDLVARMRAMAVAQRAGHPWATMSDDEMFRSAKLYDRDYTTGEEGFNLAAVLLLGKDDVIASVCPSYVTDAIVRRDDVDRYDDRLMVRTNLFDAYDRLVDFVTRSLPDRFALADGRRTSPRDVIARELVANSLMHREYSSPVVARILIGKDSIRTVNASRSFFEGRMTLGEFTPMPKNPIIADVFVQTGIAEKLGSGLRVLNRAASLYTGRKPEFRDGDIFEAMVPTLRPETASRSAVSVVTGASYDDVQNDGADAAAGEHKEVEGAPTAPGERIEVRNPSSSEAGNRVKTALRELFSRQDTVTVPQVSDSSGVSQRTVRKYLNQLVEDGSLVLEGKTRGRRYRSVG
ncbi:RNA-binding domain-containing protein [Bifidobacterium samirii]|uniref:ATPase AAA n=1 Tax=Bifidobacterium samirii TaxID=2306974 RepID=A0A430FWJ9_9BIFI|nr:RNA-binding domain-containing protein [Bifidobacterium samirii]RSX58470.1 ATPase AAA [Bifidobacterium samirii]